MFRLFKKKDEEYSIKITRSSKDVMTSEERENKFMNKALVCPECGHKNRPSWIRTEGDGRKYSVPMKCSECKCEWEYERPYQF